MIATMDHSAKKRIAFRIELTPDAKVRLVEISKKYGMKQYAVMERVTDWFARQERNIQCLVLGFYTAAMDRHVARILLRRDGKKSIT